MAILDESYKGPKLDKKTLTDWKIGLAMKQADKYRQESARYGGGSTMGAANYVAGKVVDNPLVSLRGATDVFSSAGGRAMAAPEAKRFIPEPTRSQLGGAVAQTALTLYPGATIAKAGKFAAGSILGKIASKGADKAVGAATTLAKSNVNRGLSRLAGNVASFGGAGYGYEASQNLIEGKTGAEAYTPGIGTAVSAALPFTPIVFTGAKKALGRAAQETFGATTGAGMGVVRAAYEAAKEGGEKAASFTKAMRGNTSPEEIVGAAKESLGEIIQKRSADYEQALSKVAGMTEQIDTTPVAKAIENGLKKFGVIVTPDGLDFSRSTLRFNKKAQDEIRTIVDEMAQFGSREGDNTALGVDRLKRAFSDLYSDSSEARAFVANVTGETRKLLSKVPGYDEMAKAYGDSTGLIKEIQKGLSLGNKASIDTAFRKLSTTLRTNNEFRQQLVEELDKISGGTLSAQIAGQQLSEVVPRGLAKVGVAGAGAIGLATGGLGIVALLKLAATSSPRLIGEFANALGVGARVFNKFLEGIGVKASVDAVKKTRLPGDVILDFPFGKKLKESVESMKGKGGLSLQDVTKQPGYKGTYTGETELTTKLLEDLKGRSTVSKRYLEDATNRPELKQAERDLFRNLLKQEGDNINVKDFAAKVKSELLPLNGNVNENSRIPNAGHRKRTAYENITLPDELRGPVADYQERVYESPIRTSAGNVHFGSSTDNYFAHSRIEDTPDNTRRVIEIQSDLFQKGRLEGERAHIVDMSKFENLDIKQSKSGLYYVDDGRGSRVYGETPSKVKDEIAQKENIKGYKEREKELSKLEPYRNTWHERVIREELKKAAQDGKTKVQFPTGETAMKIEGLGERNTWFSRPHNNTPEQMAERKLKSDNLRVGQDVYQNGNEGDSWIITDVLGDGKFKAIQKKYQDLQAKNWKIFKDDSVKGETYLTARNELTGDMKSIPFAKGNEEKARKYLEEYVGTDEDLSSLGDKYGETFDISGKVDKENPIYKFYEKTVSKYLNKFGGKLVTDKQGVSWVEVPVKKEMATQPVMAFANATGAAGGFINEEGELDFSQYNAKNALIGLGVGVAGIKGASKIGRGFGTGAGRKAVNKSALLTESKEKLSNFLKGLKTDKMNESDAAEFIKNTEKSLKPSLSAERIKSYMDDVQFEIDRVLKERGKSSVKIERVKTLMQSAAKATDYTSWIKSEGLKASETMKQLYIDAKRQLKK